MIKVGINGFGRIGRFVFRAAQKRNDIQIVGINDLCPVDYLAYMLKYDTMHGAFDGTIEADVANSKLIVNGKEIFRGKLKCTLANLVNSCAAFYDPNRLYPAAIEVDLSQL